MFNQIFSNDSIHTQGAYEIDRQVRARQRYIALRGVEEPVQIIQTDKPSKDLLVGLVSSIWLFLGI